MAAGRVVLRQSRRFRVEALPDRGVVRKAVCATDPADRARAVAALRREAATLERLAPHPDTPTLRRVDLAADPPHIEVDRIPGAPLSAWWPRSRPGDPASIAVAARLARGVATLHALGVIHRDLKASNVLIDADGRVVLIDFDLAGTDGDTGGGGTRRSAAPEVRWLPDPRLIDHRADLYSVGLLLDRLVLGGPSEVDPETLFARMTGRAGPEGTPTGIDPGVAAYIRRLRDPWRDRRPAGIDPLATVLEAMAAGVDPPPDTLDALALPEAPDPAPIRAGMAAMAPAGGGPADLPWDQWREALARALDRGDGRSLVRLGAVRQALDLADVDVTARLALDLDAAQAARDALAAARADPPPPWRLALHAEATARLGDLAGAQRLLCLAVDRIGDLTPSGPGCAWFGPALGRTLLATAAITDLPEILALAPRSCAPQLARGALGAITAALHDFDHVLQRRMDRHPDRKAILAAAGQPFVREAYDVVGVVAEWLAGSADPAVRADAHRWCALADDEARIAPAEPSWAADLEDDEPDPGPGWGEAAVTAARHGDRDRAIAAVLDHLEDQPRDATAWALLLGLDQRIAPVPTHGAQIALIDTLAEVGFEAHALLHWRMAAAVDAGRPDRAIEAIARAARRHPIGWEAWFTAALAWRTLGRNDHVEQAIAHMVGAGAPSEALDALRIDGPVAEPGAPTAHDAVRPPAAATPR